MLEWFFHLWWLKNYQKSYEKWKLRKKIIPPIVPKKIPPPAHYNSSPNFSFLLAHDCRDPVSMGAMSASPPMFFSSWSFHPQYFTTFSLAYTFKRKNLSVKYSTFEMKKSTHDFKFLTGPLDWNEQTRLCSASYYHISNYKSQEHY